MASIGSVLLRIKGELENLIPKDLVNQLCREAGYAWRERGQCPSLVIQLLLAQLLTRVSLAGLRHPSKINLSKQAFCQARQRLPLSILAGLVEYVCRQLALSGRVVGQAGADLWQGLRVFIPDGTRLLLEDKEELVAKYGRAKNQKGNSNSYPVPVLLAMLDYASGMIAKAILLPRRRGERSGLSRMFKAIGRGAIIVADRGLVSFAHVALMIQEKVECCLRLPRYLKVDQGGRPRGRQVRKLGRQDWLVRWSKNRRPVWLKPSEWAKLPEHIEVRQIAYQLKRKGYRTHWAWLVTTLTDPQKYPARDVVELYQRRWQVEVYFRDMKNSLHLQKLAAHSPAGVQKELLGYVLLYNLVRQVMLEAAGRQGVEPERISFRDALQWLLYAAPGEPLAELVVNPKRQRATQPRQIKQGRKRYPQIRQPRRELCRPRFTAEVPQA